MVTQVPTRISAANKTVRLEAGLARVHDGRGQSHQYGNGGLLPKGNSMRFATKAAIMGAFAGPAIAALILTGAGPANAAVTTTTTHTTSSSSSPFFPFCSPRHLERWNFNGYNTVDLSYGTSSYTYSVHFVQRGSCLSGSLTDTGLMAGEQTGPIHGTVVREPGYVQLQVSDRLPGNPDLQRLHRPAGACLRDVVRDGLRGRHWLLVAGLPREVSVPAVLPVAADSLSTVRGARCPSPISFYH